MEDLGDLCGLDYNTAYFIKYGRNAPVYTKEYKYVAPDIDWERVNEPDPYYCWRGTQIPSWFQ